jgi:hypothetical protein
MRTKCSAWSPASEVKDFVASATQQQLAGAACKIDSAQHPQHPLKTVSFKVDRAPVAPITTCYQRQLQWVWWVWWAGGGRAGVGSFGDFGERHQLANGRTQTQPGPLVAAGGPVNAASFRRTLPSTSWIGASAPRSCGFDCELARRSARAKAEERRIKGR